MLGKNKKRLNGFLKLSNYHGKIRGRTVQKQDRQIQYEILNLPIIKQELDRRTKTMVPLA